MDFDLGDLDGVLAEIEEQEAQRKAAEAEAAAAGGGSVDGLIDLSALDSSAAVASSSVVGSANGRPKKKSNPSTAGRRTTDTNTNTNTNSGTKKAAGPAAMPPGRSGMSETVRNLDIAAELALYTDTDLDDMDLTPDVPDIAAKRRKEEERQAKQRRMAEPEAAPWGEQTVRVKEKKMQQKKKKGAAEAVAGEGKKGNRGRVASLVRVSAKTPQVDGKTYNKAEQSALQGVSVVRRNNAKTVAREEEDDDAEPTPKKLDIPPLNAKLPHLKLVIDLLDGKAVDVVCTSDWKVKELTWKVAEQLKVWQVDFFSLCETDPKADHADRWLAPEKTLKQEGIESNSHLLFKIKYFKFPKKLRDPLAVHFFYVQMRHEILCGMVETSEVQAFRLAALSLHIDQKLSGQPRMLKPGGLSANLPRYLAQEHAENGWQPPYHEKRILNAYKRFKGMEQKAATYAYLKTVKDLPLYGSAIFNVAIDEKPRVFAVAEDGFLVSEGAKQKFQFFTVRNTEVTRYIFTPYSKLRRLTYDKHTVSLVIGEEGEPESKYSTLLVQCAERNAESIVELLCGYRKMLEPYALLDESFEYPLHPSIPDPLIYAKPPKRAKTTRQTSRVEVFKIAYLKQSAAHDLPLHFPLVEQLDFCLDVDEPLKKFSSKGLMWNGEQVVAFFEAIAAAKTYGLTSGEDFLENMPLTTLDLSDLRLDKETLGRMDDFFALLSGHPFRVEHLVLKGCGFTDKSMAQMRDAICKLTNLVSADLSKNQLREEGAKSLLLGMRDANPHFTSVALGSNLLTDKALKLVSAMLDRNGKLQVLHLPNNALPDTAIGYLLKGLEAHRGIQSLDLSGNKFSAKRCAQVLRWAIATTQLQELKMAKLGMHAKLADGVAALIAKVPHQLRALDVSGNSFGRVGSGKICMALAKTSRMRQLDISSLELEGKSLKLLAEHLKAAGAKYERLCLRNLNLNKKLTARLLEVLRSTIDKSMKLLDLSSMAFPGEAVGTAFAMMMSYTGIEELRLRKTTWDKKSWTHLCRGVIKSRSLKVLYLDDVKLSKDMIAALAEALKENNTVEEISFRRTQITHDMLAAFLRLYAEGSMSELRKIDVRDCREMVGMLEGKHAEAYKKVQQVAWVEFVYTALDLRKSGSRKGSSGKGSSKGSSKGSKKK